jgi:hypothetical protein
MGVWGVESYRKGSFGAAADDIILRMRRRGKRRGRRQKRFASSEKRASESGGDEYPTRATGYGSLRRAKVARPHERWKLGRDGDNGDAVVAKVTVGWCDDEEYQAATIWGLTKDWDR